MCGCKEQKNKTNLSSTRHIEHDIDKRRKSTTLQITHRLITANYRASSYSNRATRATGNISRPQIVI